MSERQASPETLHPAFEDAFNRHDVAGVVSLYEPSAVVVGSDGAIEGTNAIGEFYRRLFAYRPAMTLRTARVSRCGDLAILHGDWRWRGTQSDGGAIDRRGRSVEVVRRQPDGRWLYVIDDPSLP